MSNSTLTNFTVLSPNHSGLRKSKITRITPHCVVGQLSADAVAASFKKPVRQASANYVIGKDGEICQCVLEENRSWCSSNADNDNRAVTIECASDNFAPYKMSDTVYRKLIDLMTDICRRNRIRKLIWIPNKQKALNYAVKDGECLITVHRWFAAKDCPGDWLFTRLGEVADTVTSRLKEVRPSTVYLIQCGVFRIAKNARIRANDLEEAGFECSIIEDDGTFRIQCGAFVDYNNAKRVRDSIKEKGFNAVIRKDEVR